MAGSGDLRIDVRSDMKRVIAEFQAVTQEVETKALVRALNRSAESLRTEIGREVRKVYNVKLRAVRRATQLRRASENNLVASVRIEGARIRLAEFSPRAVNPWNVKGRSRKPGGGVSVQIKVGGGRKLVQSAFLARASRNNARGGGSAGQLHVWRRRDRARDSMVTLRSISIPQAVSNELVRKALLELSDKAFEKAFRQQLTYLRRPRG